MPWSESWRNFIRAGETAFVAVLVIGAPTASDMLVVMIFLVIAFVVSAIAIVAEPTISVRWKSGLIPIALLAFIGIYEFAYYRHQEPIPEALLGNYNLDSATFREYLAAQ